jgi:hypothetical protein
MSEPQQKDLLTQRWRKVRAPAPLEHQLQIALIQHLQYRARPGVIYFHVPNGELRDKRAAAKLKAMGVLPGVADLVFVWDDDGLRNLYLELKAKGRRQTLEQITFAEVIQVTGASYRVAATLDDALAILKSFNLLKG